MDSDSVMSEGLKQTLGIVATDAEKRRVARAARDESAASEKLALLNPPKPKSNEIMPFVPRSIPTTIPLSVAESDLRDDYVTSRNITHSLIDYAGNALQGALTVAIETQHPKAFEVFDKLANTMRGLSRDLIDMQKVYQSIVDAANGKIAQNITQNNITINPDGSGMLPGEGATTNTSMSDIVKMIKKMADKTTAAGESKKAAILKNAVDPDDASDADFIEMKG